MRREATENRQEATGKERDRGSCSCSWEGVRTLFLALPPSGAPKVAEADSHHLIVGHRAAQVADGLGEAVEPGDGLFVDDRVVERQVPFNDRRDQLPTLFGKPAPPHLFSQYLLF